MQSNYGYSNSGAGSGYSGTAPTYNPPGSSSGYFGARIVNLSLATPDRRPDLVAVICAT